MMKALLAASLMAFAPLTALADQVLVPQHMLVPVELIDTVESKSAKAGDEFHFQTTTNTTIGGQIVIPMHSIGSGTIAQAGPAGSNGKTGSLVLEARYLTLPSGMKLMVSVDRASSKMDAQGTRKNLPWFLGWVPIPYFGLAVGAVNQVKSGTNVTLAKGTAFQVVTVDETTVSVTTAPTVPAIAPQTALQTPPAK